MTYMRRYHFDPDVPGYESDLTQNRLHSATVWCVHLHVDTLLTSAAALTAIESFGPVNLLTYEYFEGSWAEWGTDLDPDTDETGWSLVVYYHAPDLTSAWQSGCWIANQLNLKPEQFGVTTSGDWAENAQPRDTAPFPDDYGWLDVARAVGVVDE